jgi:hypothetical protein
MPQRGRAPRLRGWMAKPHPSWLLVVVAGFLAGYFLLPGGWWREVWLWALILPAVVFERRRPTPPSSLTSGGGPLAVTVGWLLGFWLLTVAQHGWPGMTAVAGAARDVAGVVLLVRAVAWAAPTVQQAALMQRWCVGAAVLAALVSLAVFYGFNGATSFGERLRNWFVHGGQHPVPTAMTFGFAAMWAGLGLASSGSRRAAWGWGTALLLLNVAVACGQSRGASLAMVTASLLLAGIVRRKRACLPLLFVVAALVCFHLLSPHLAPRAEASRRHPGETLVPAASANPYDARLPRNGLQNWVERGDAGRLALYRLLLKRLDLPADRFLGKGWFAPHSGAAELGWPATHPHSVLMSTLYHGGQIAVVGLAFLAVFMFTKAISLFRRGLGPDTLVMLCYGSVALLFDGESLTSLFTQPGFESLVFWVPVGLIAARCVMLPMQDTVFSPVGDSLRTAPGAPPA